MTFEIITSTALTSFDRENQRTPVNYGFAKFCGCTVQ